MIFKKYFNNWNQNVKAVKTFYPKTKDEIIEIIGELKKNNQQVHACGSLNSNAAIIESDYLISTKRLNKVLWLDKEKHLVKIESGITLEELNLFLVKNNLALANICETTAPTLGGIISTATHGTGHTGSLSSFVTEIELITSQQNVLVLSEQQNPEEFAAAKVSIGALGIIYSIVLKCVPLFNLIHSRTVSNWQQTKNNYIELKQNDYFMFFLNPYSLKTSNFIWNKTLKNRTKFYSWFRYGLDKMFFNFGIQKFWDKFLQMFPKFLPSLIDTFFELSVRSDVVDYGYKLLSEFQKPNDNKIDNEQEISVPIDKLIPAGQEVIDLIHKYKKDNFYVWLILFRFVKADHNILLSPNADRDSVYISISNSKRETNVAFYKEFEEIMLKYNGRPHWAKIHFLTSQTAKQLYGNNWDRFIAIRKKLDPQNMFLNSFVQQVLSH